MMLKIPPFSAFVPSVMSHQQSLTHPCCLWCSLSAESTPDLQLQPSLAELSLVLSHQLWDRHSSALARTELLGWGDSRSTGDGLCCSSLWVKWGSSTSPPCWSCLGIARGALHGGLGSAVPTGNLGGTQNVPTLGGNGLGSNLRESCRHPRQWRKGIG